MCKNKKYKYFYFSTRFGPKSLRDCVYSYLRIIKNEG